MLTIILMVISQLMTPAPPSIYDYSFKTLEGKTIKFSQFKGKKILVVNTASKCGYTPQYEELEKLHQKYKNKLVVIGFPAGNFGGQELATNAEIGEFCKENYGVSFMMSEKSSVKGNDISPLFKFLTQTENSDFKGDIKWNFEKFLIDESGKLVHRYRSAVKPLSAEITSKL